MTSTFLTGLLWRVNETKDKQHRAQCPAGREMLVITVVALDSFWQTSSLSYILEFEKNHTVLQESRIDVRDIRKILWDKELI